jgi:hypothetical protein
MCIRARHCALDIQRFGAERLKSKLVSVCSKCTLLGTQQRLLRQRSSFTR